MNTVVLTMTILSIFSLSSSFFSSTISLLLSYIYSFSFCLICSSFLSLPLNSSPRMSGEETSPNDMVEQATNATDTTTSCPSTSCPSTSCPSTSTEENSEEGNGGGQQVMNSSLIHLNQIADRLTNPCNPSESSCK